MHLLFVIVRVLKLKRGSILFSAMSFQLVPLFVVHLCRKYLNALQSDSTWSPESGKQQCQLLTMHWQKTGLDNLTSAMVRYQLLFGAGPLRLTF